MINLDGTGLERITSAEGFDGFPVFSADGRYLVFGSNRNNGDSSDTNVFIAEWSEGG
jgi:Tol biopolymer transport system component